MKITNDTKMTKKLITITVFLGLVMMFGSVGCAKAVTGADVVFSADTPMPIYKIGTTTASDLKVKASSQAAAIATDTDRVTVTLLSGSDITFKSASGEVMSVTGCTSTHAVFTAGTPSLMQIQHDSTCVSAVLTIGTGGLTEVNIKGAPLTAAATATVYTVTFKTVKALLAGEKIKLAFGTGYGISSGTVAVKDDTVTIGSSSSVSAKEVTITLTPAVVEGSVIDITLTNVVTNPTAASLIHTNGAPDVTVLGIDISTTTATGTTIDALADQTPYNRIIELEPGWNVFAPSQTLEDYADDYADVLAPIFGSYDAVYTLTRSAGVMSWLPPTRFDPLYGYAIHITGSSTVKLPLDFAKETPSNFAFSRELEHKGWFLIGYAGDSGYLDAYDSCLDGLVHIGTTDHHAYDVIIDLTGASILSATSQTSHAWAADPTEQTDGSGNMRFTKDYGFAISVNTVGMTLTGNREE